MTHHDKNRRCSEEKKKGTTTACTKQSCELSRHRNRTNIRLAVFWLFVMFAVSQIKASEKDPEYCKNGCETLFLGNLWCRQPISKKTAIHSLYVCCSHWHVCPMSMGNNSPVFFFPEQVYFLCMSMSMPFLCFLLVAGFLEGFCCCWWCVWGEGVCYSNSKVDYVADCAVTLPLLSWP